MTLYNYYENAINECKRDISSKNDDYLLGVNVDQLLKYYLTKYQLPLIEKDEQRDISYERQKTRYRTLRDVGIIVGSEIPVKIFYPIIPKARIEEVIRLRASSYLVGFEITCENSYLVTEFSLSGGAANEERIQRVIENIETTVNYKNNNVKAGNEQLKNELSTFINHKIERIKSDERLLEETIKKVSINLKKREKAAPMVNLSIKEAIQPIYPTAEKKTEPFIEEKTVNAVIELLESAGLSFETTPAVYSQLEEEQLRDILLSQLNCVFQGDATGETFVKKGKTDIHLKMSKGSILSIECKFWEGEKTYLAMINQLFGYLTWRQNYGILLTFSRRENFSEVIAKAKQVAESHCSAISNSLIFIGKSHFKSINKFPEDAAKSVTLHHLLFNLYFK